MRASPPNFTKARKMPADRNENARPARGRPGKLGGNYASPTPNAILGYAAMHGCQHSRRPNQQTEGPPSHRQPFKKLGRGTFRSLLQRGGHAREGGRQGGSSGLHSRDDRNGNARCNQTVFNRRSARLIVPELTEIASHHLPLRGLESFAQVGRYLTSLVRR